MSEPVVEQTLATEIDQAIEAVTKKPDDVSTETATEKVSDTSKTETSTGVENKVETEEKKKVVADETGTSTERTPEEIKKAEEAKKPTPPVFSDDTVIRAIHAGFTPADIRAFQDESSLLRVVTSVEAAIKPRETVEDQTSDDDVLSAIPELDPEVYDEETIKLYNGLAGVIKKQQEAIQALRANQEQVVRGNQEVAARDIESWFDEQVNKLGDDFKEVLGTGKYRELQIGTPQHTKRDAIANQTAILLAGYRASGLQAPSRDEVFSQAARMVLADDFQKVHEKKLSEDLAKRETQHINRATNAGSKSKGDPVADIAAMLDQKYFGKS